MTDPYLELINEHWNEIRSMYKYFEDKKPIIEFNVKDSKIYSYPAEEYLNLLLTGKNRDQAKETFHETVRNNQFMVFVKDFDKKNLRSFVFDLED